MVVRTAKKYMQKKRSKRYREAAAKVEANKKYNSYHKKDIKKRVHPNIFLSRIGVKRIFIMIK